MRGASPFRFDGTIDRAQYLAFNLAWFALVVLTGAATAVGISASGDITVAALAFVAAALLGAVARLSYAVRRLRHIGWHPAWSLLAFVPMAALAVDLALVLIPGAPARPGGGGEAASGRGAEAPSGSAPGVSGRGPRAEAGARHGEGASRHGADGATGEWRWTDAGWRREPRDGAGPRG